LFTQKGDENEIVDVVTLTNKMKKEMNVQYFNSMKSNYSREKVFFLSAKIYELQFLNLK
jgi:hypothetical protein